MKPLKFLFALLALIPLCLASCKKESDAPFNSDNLEVTVSIPSTGFHVGSKIYVYVYNVYSYTPNGPTSGAMFTDSTANGGTVSFRLSTGSYLVFASGESDDLNYHSVYTSYPGSQGEQGGVSFEVNEAYLTSIDLRNWCQGAVGGSTYCY